MRYQLLLFLSLIVTITSAQSDELGMRFQAVARDADGAVIANESLTTRVELLLAGQNDIVLYREFHDVETNRYGLISLTIGEGVPTFGAFADIPWEERNIWTRISIKRAADPDFSVVSTSRLLSVPYAQYAEKAGSVTGFDQGSGQFSLGPGESTEWSVHGNANTNKFTDDPKLGPLDENSLKIITNREERIFIDSDGSTFIHGPTTIGGPDTTATFFTGDVVMKGGLSVSEDAEFLGETTFGGAGQSTTTFLGNVQVNNDINVDGNSTLNGITTIGGPEMNNALFTGAVSVNKGLSVDSSTFLNGSTFIGGVDMNPTRILGDLQVNKDLAIGGKVRVLDTLDVFGRTTFTIDVDGEQTDQSSYPVLIRGSKQGLAIDLVPATDNILISNRGNNYISFWRNGEQKGRIEGMGRADLDPTGLTNLIVQLVSDPPSSISTPGIVGGDYLPFSVGNPENIVGLIDFDPGGLPNLINNLSFDPGSLPSLSFDPLSLDPGSLPSLTTSIPFDPGILPSVDFSGLEGFIQFQNPFEGGDFEPFETYINDFTPEDALSPAGVIWGTIRSLLMTADLYPTDPNFESQLFSNYTLDVLQQGISTLSAAVTFFSSLASVLDPEDIFAQGVDVIANIVSLVIYGAYTDINLGVAYESGAGDYAEWLLRANPDELIRPGDVVGVIGGKISKEFTHADRFMVVSTSPMLLGNMPSTKAEEYLYEKVAFVGQVPVKVIGKVNIGDYILPSGNGDGVGIAIAPEDMLARDYQRIVGVAWEENTTDGFIKLINTAVGLNHNDMSKMIEQMQVTLNSLQAAVAKLDPSFEAHYYEVTETASAQPTQSLDYSVAPTHPSSISRYFAGKSYASEAEMLAAVKEALQNHAGIDLGVAPIVEYVLDHPEQASRIAEEYQVILEDMISVRNEIATAQVK